MYHIGHDPALHDTETGRKAECRALNITEELGQVSVRRFILNEFPACGGGGELLYVRSMLEKFHFLPRNGSCKRASVQHGEPLKLSRHYFSFAPDTKSDLIM